MLLILMCDFLYIMQVIATFKQQKAIKLDDDTWQYSAHFKKS